MKRKIHMTGHERNTIDGSGAAPAAFVARRLKNADTMKAIFHWLTHRPGYMLLTAGDEELSAERPERFARAWMELLILSLGWGMAMWGIWAGLWPIFGPKILPAILVGAFWLLWPGRRVAASTAEFLGGRNVTNRAIAASIWAILLVVCLAMLEQTWRRDSPLPGFLAWFRPSDKIYRPLILMPLWGCWAMLITPQFCKPRHGCSPAVAAFARGCGALSAAAVMGLLLAVTIIYFNYLPWEQLGISGVAIATAVIAGIVCCRLRGGLCRSALLGANAATQMAFLLACVAAQHLLLRWY